MTYLAIARKYRPSTFDEMVGQDHVTTTLRNAITRSRIHHAYLFCGARGVGKTTAARALARALNCAEGPTPTPCGVCPSCRDIAAGNSPDLIEIDGASNNSVDDIRELRETVRYAPTQGRHKVYLVDEVHMLSGSAFNALLKTFEEPPPHVVFLFATTEPHKIPDTILSRVQRFDFRRIPGQVVVERLTSIAQSEGVTISEGALRRIARAGEGSMRDAQSLLDKVIAFSGEAIADADVAQALGLIDPALVVDLLGALVHGDAAAALDKVAAVHNLGHDLSQLTDDLLEACRNATFLRLSPEVRAHIDLAAEELSAIETAVGQTPPEALSRLFSALIDVHDQVSRAARQRIVLDMAIARLADVRPAAPVSALVAKLEAIERRLRQAGATRPTGAARGRGVGGPARHHSPQRATPTPRAGREASTRSSQPKLPPDAGDDDRWAAFHAGALRLVPPPLDLMALHPRRQGTELILSGRAGRNLANARRDALRRDVARVLHECYGEEASLRIEESRVVHAPGADDALERAVLADPMVQRILSTLGAHLVEVAPASQESHDEPK